MYDNEYDLWECRQDMKELNSRLDDALDALDGHTPYFLVGLTADNPYKRVYIAAFSTKEKVEAFVRSCQRKKDGDFKVRSPLGRFMDFEIVRFYAPELPIDPQNYEG